MSGARSALSRLGGAAILTAAGSVLGADGWLDPGFAVVEEDAEARGAPGALAREPRVEGEAPALGAAPAEPLALAAGEVEVVRASPPPLFPQPARAASTSRQAPAV